MYGVFEPDYWTLFLLGGTYHGAYHDASVSGETMKKFVLLVVPAMMLIAGSTLSIAQEPGQSRLDPAKAEASRKYPRITLYSVAWCPHCREAKEYFTKNNIPFVNRDVEQDAGAMAELTGKYKSQGVPVIVIGSGKDEVVVKGFNPESFQESLRKAQGKR
ncbi:hypothetical protein GSbR_30830 [Geobacter sp. SVR]|nr:hypothetical protein GSbR_30830 [Geobacter sp. SVR]